MSEFLAFLHSNKETKRSKWCHCRKNDLVSTLEYDPKFNRQKNYYTCKLLTV